MNKVAIAAILSLTALQPALADSTSLQGVMNESDEKTLQLYPATLESPRVAPAQMDEQLSSTADAPESLVSQLRWHDEALVALGLKLRVDTSFESLQRETSSTNSMNQDCAFPSTVQNASFGTASSANSSIR
jgi:hypothetical protein